jgi:acetyltransferase-like isoleucine patch superfamily enzyme
MTRPETAARWKIDWIIIQDGVWTGAESVVIGGGRIGENSLIGAGSVVVTDIPDRVIAVANPCSSIKRWESTLNVMGANRKRLRARRVPI